jgi:hypothetical protein
MRSSSTPRSRRRTKIHQVCRLVYVAAADPLAYGIANCSQMEDVGELGRPALWPPMANSASARYPATPASALPPNTDG